MLDFLNIPKQMKKLYIKRKLSKHKNNPQKKDKKKIMLKIINILIITIMLLGVGYLGYIYREKNLLYVIIGFSLIGTIILIRVLSNKKEKKDNYQEITELILKGEDGDNIRSWDLKNKVSLLIGKKTKGNDIDIDLGKATYATLISREHGVLNRANNSWYFEDIGSSNGSGIKKNKTAKKVKIKPGQPCKLESQDIIYIANTKLLLK
ncbi:MAG: FHA domain-containing protein [Fusobacteriota bacterium]